MGYKDAMCYHENKETVIIVHLMPYISIYLLMNVVYIHSRSL